MKAGELGGGFSEGGIFEKNRLTERAVRAALPIILLFASIPYVKGTDMTNYSGMQCRAVPSLPQSNKPALLCTPCASARRQG